MTMLTTWWPSLLWLTLVSAAACLLLLIALRALLNAVMSTTSSELTALREVADALRASAPHPIPSQLYDSIEASVIRHRDDLAVVQRRLRVLGGERGALARALPGQIHTIRDNAQLGINLANNVLTLLKARERAESRA
jgi:hypothetical protein